MTEPKLQTSMRFRAETVDMLTDLAGAQGVSRTTVVDRLITKAHADMGSSDGGTQSSGQGVDVDRDANLFERKCRPLQGRIPPTWLQAVRNIHDTMDFAVDSLRSTVGEHFKHADAIALTKLMVDEKARLDGGE